METCYRAVAFPAIYAILAVAFCVYVGFLIGRARERKSWKHILESHYSRPKIDPRRQQGIMRHNRPSTEDTE